MDKKYRAVEIEVRFPPETEYDRERTERRYAIVDTETGEVLDDAQGYGYKTAQKAYAAYSYRTRDRSKDRERAERERTIAAWMKENKGFVREMDAAAFEILKGSCEPGIKMNAALVKEMLEENGYAGLPFTAGQLLAYWRKGPVYSRKKKKRR